MRVEFKVLIELERLLASEPIKEELEKEIISLVSKYKALLPENNPSETNVIPDNVEIYPTETIRGEFTIEQQNAYSKALSFIKNGAGKRIRITGAAGTGKSYLIQKITQELSRLKMEWLVACPTNKAAKNIEKGLNLSVKGEVITVASLLGLKPQIDVEKGEEVFMATDSGRALNTVKVIILDEYSMVKEDDYKQVCYLCQLHGIKLVVVGDGEQLPPVGEVNCAAVKDTDIEEEIVLTEIVRYSGDLLRVANDIRTRTDFKGFRFTNTEDRSIIVKPQTVWEELFLSSIKREEFRKNPEYARALAWTNRRVEELNTTAREHLWEYNLKEINVGELLTLTRPAFDLKDPKRGYQQDNTFIWASVSTEFWVIDEPTPMIERNHDYEYWLVKVAKANVPLSQALANKDSIIEGVNDRYLKILKSSEKHKYSGQINQVKKDKDWKQFYYLTQFFSSAQFAYALTVHRSQGSSINNVYLDAEDLLRCKERKQILYTALTRAVDRVVVTH